MDLVLDRLLALSTSVKAAADGGAAGLRRVLSALDLRNDPDDPKAAGHGAAEPLTGAPADALTAAERPRFLVVHQRLPALPFGEVLLLLPEGSSSADGDRTFELPAGSVWIRARLLVPGAAGYAGLRIRGGRLALGTAALVLPEGRIAIPLIPAWTLTLEPEPPPAAEAGGSDAHALALTLPERLEVRPGTAPAVSGSLAMAGFGSALAFVPAAGGPVAGAGAIEFPFEPAAAEGAVWTIAGNRSAAVQLAGSCPVASAAWSLPSIPAASGSIAETAGEAAHGGSLVMRLLDGFRLALPGLSGGALRAAETLLTANAERLLLEIRQAAAAGRLELELWRPAESRCVFGREPLSRVLFASERATGDAVLVEGGRLRNRWDLPLAAAGEPFPFEGRIEVFAVTALPGGLHLSCVAAQPPAGHVHGLALENLYLTVHEPRRLAFFGSFDGASAVADGTALLFFDVALAQPMLPDPYAANWPLPDEANVRESALSLTLRWAGAEPPAIESRLEGRLAFPAPRGLPDDEDPLLRALFDRHLDARREPLSLLDLSSRDHHFGVALETLADQEAVLDGNRLAVPLRGVRLLLQPQVQWEPVQVVPNPAANVHQAETVTSRTHGARTLAGADHVKLVPVLPGLVSQEWVQAAREGRPCGALFSLPFGLRAFARLDAREAVPLAIPPIEAGLHTVDLAGLHAALQLRLAATGGRPPGERAPDRTMPGALRQLPNLAGSANGLGSVLGNEIELQMTEFLERLPLHQADLSGYGLSTFSDWRRETDVGVTQMRFDVLTGRTSLEVVQTRTVLAACQARAVRTVILERRNAGRVLRFDSGWQPIDDGTFSRYAPFDKGVVVAFRNLRNIRILPRPLVTLGDGSVWQAVLYDCDAELADVVAGGPGGRVPVRDHAGYVQIAPTGPGAAPTPERFAALFARVGPVGGPLDCALRVGGTLPFQTSGLFADASPDGTPVTTHSAVAVYGSPGLPRAGQWSAVRIAGASGEAAPVDPRHGVPVIRLPGQPYTFRDPADARRPNPAAEHGFLMATATSRVLFPRPAVDPAEPGVLRTAAPLAADPLALAQSTGAFPRPAYALRAAQPARFEISAAGAWRLTTPGFDLAPPAPVLAKGGAWAIGRAFPPAPRLDALIDSALAAKPWEIDVTPNDLEIDVDPFGTLFVIKTGYRAESGALAKLPKPTLDFGPALDAARELVNVLQQFVDLPFDFAVDVAAGSGPSPSFVVRIELKIRLGERPNERIDIGLGKLYGELRVRGELEATISGSTRGRLLAELQGDVQQGILPPLLFAGGMFRFAVEIRETGPPLVELGLGVTASIGGDLIKGLVEVEVTVTYGYLLIPETLQPGVLLGLEARAKLLAGLLGFSFAVQAMASIQRASLKEVTIRADIRVVATAQVAWLVEDDIDMRTRFEQTLPLEVAGLGPGDLLAPVSDL